MFTFDNGSFPFSRYFLLTPLGQFRHGGLDEKFANKKKKVFAEYWWHKHNRIGRGQFIRQGFPSLYSWGANSSNDTFDLCLHRCSWISSDKSPPPKSLARLDFLSSRVNGAVLNLRHAGLTPASQEKNRVISFSLSFRTFCASREREKFLHSWAGNDGAIWGQRPIQKKSSRWGQEL